MTARVTCVFKRASAMRRSSPSTAAATSCGVIAAPRTLKAASPRGPCMSCVDMSAAMATLSAKPRPMKRLALAIVASANCAASFLACQPTMDFSPCRNRTTLGSSARPCSSSKTRGPASSQIATSECVVPRSIPTMGDMGNARSAVLLKMTAELLLARHLARLLAELLLAQLLAELLTQ